jgi:hypothetical protein
VCNQVDSIPATLKEPYTHRKASLVAVALGGLAALSPLLGIALDRLNLLGILSIFIPSIALLVFVFLVTRLYLKRDKSSFQQGRWILLVSLLPLCVFSAGVWGSLWCRWHHICKCGHMAHGPYPAYYMPADVAWSAAILLAATWLFTMRSSLCIPTIAFTVFMLIHRFAFGGFGGIYLLPI